MLYFFICVGLLIIGYFTYGKFVEKVFGFDVNRATPATTMEDGVDFIPMPTWKVYLIQLLNIAGIGPIFGPILGALYGPQALIWIVVGSIFAGGVHDYFSGMLSIRNKGENIPEVVGDALGMPARQVMRLFSIILLILVGVVFVMAPAKLLGELTGFNVRVLTIAIFVYYFAATILPIDKIIGRFYPFFGGLLLFMTFGIVIALIVKGYDVIPNMDFFKNYNPRTSYDGRQLPLWPLLFITISCGAISGFHSTQSPLMSRCLKNEKMGRPVFYGAMITEGIIALIWATVGLSFYKTPELLNAVIVKGTPSAVVNEVSRSLLGTFGGFLAVLGVIVLPITSGDTAFRSTRLIIADVLKVKQTKPIKRLLVAVPLFIVGYFLTFVNFQLIWRYFGWSNQTLAMLVLWSSAVWLLRKKKCHWIASIPATFMTAVTVSFIMYMKIGFQLSYGISNVIGITAAVVAFICFMIFGRKKEEPEKKD